MKSLQVYPPLRFSGFNQAWRSFKLKEISTFFNGRAFKQTELQQAGKYPVLRVGNLFTNENWYYSDLELDQDKHIDNGDLIYAWSATFGPRIWLGPKVIYHYHIWKVACDKSLLDKSFYYHLLNIETSKLKSRSTNGFALLHITKGTIEEWQALLPSLPEQQKIAAFLSSIDKRIEQLTKKKTLLEQYKKGVMQQLFSRKIRFKDEDGKEFPEWEEKKLADIGDFQTSSVDKLSREHEKEVYLVNYMNVYRHERIDNSTVENLSVVTAKDSQIEGNNLLRGDILFTPSSETPTDIGHSVVIFEDVENAVYSYHVLRFRPKIELDIMYSHYFCNTQDVLRQLSRFATGSTRFTISVGNFGKVTVGLPCIEEQSKIANFLSTIDSKIVLVNTQLENILQLKKGLLQKMFV